jgi:predicted transcriptional regulator
MSSPKTEQKNTEDEYKTISIKDPNKKSLEKILRALENFHDKNFRIDIAVGHILKVYGRLKNKEKYYGLI